MRQKHRQRLFQAGYLFRLNQKSKKKQMVPCRQEPQQEDDIMYRDHTKTVKIGNRVIGGGNPVLIQSMTNTKTEDVEATVNQINLYLLRQDATSSAVRCRRWKRHTHFRRSKNRSQFRLWRIFILIIVWRSLRWRAGADKIRINPGNIGSTERVHAVVDVAKERQIPIRVGVNSGSLEKELVEK